MFFLKKNMRLDQTPECELFAQYLLKVGAGKIPILMALSLYILKCDVETLLIFSLMPFILG